jgi:SpoIID/LytB domain protein
VAVLLAAGGLLLGGAGPAPAAPAVGTAAAAATTVYQTYARPAGTTMSLAGHGYGHGRGMSQWGAYGAATKGLSWSQITAFYYPGTSRAAQGNPPIRVLLQDLGTSATVVTRQDGLSLSDGDSTSNLRLSSGPARWRIVPDGAGLTLQWLSGSTWTSSTKWRAWTKPLTFTNPVTGVLRTVLPAGSLRDYRGAMVAHRSGSGLVTVDHTATERYLYSVVPSEMPASWSANALRAQAVAARTYAAWKKAHTTSALYDTCDTTACQRYTGIADLSSSGTVTRRYEQPSTTAAVDATAGSVLRYAGAPAFTEFSASDGGVVADGGQPYLVAKTDPYDGVVASPSNPHNWSTSVTLSAVEAAYPAVGRLTALEVRARTGWGDWGGRVATLRVVGASGSVTVTGDAFRTALGLRSTWWAMTSPPARSAPTFPKDLTGDGLADLLAVDGSGRLLVLRNTGSQEFTPVTANTGQWGSLGLLSAAGTMDSDNLGDVIARGSDGSVTLYRGGTSATLNRGSVRLTTGWNAVVEVVPVGDLSGDGHTDLLARWSNGTLVLYRGDGAGALTGSEPIGAGWGQFRATVSPGDLTGDGRPDVLAVRSSDGRMFLYAGNTQGRLDAAVPVGTRDWRAYHAVRGVGDLTGDGRADVLTRRTSDRTLWVFPGRGDGTLGDPVGFGSTPYWQLGQ